MKKHELNIKLTDKEKSSTLFSRFSKYTVLEMELRKFMDQYGWQPSDVRDFGEVPHYQNYFVEYKTTVHLLIDPMLNDHYHYNEECKITGIIFSKRRYLVSVHDKRYSLDKVDEKLLNFINTIFQDLVSS